MNSTNRKEEKIRLTREQLCYKRHRNTKRKGMMSHKKWNLDNKVPPIRLRLEYIELRTKLGHLEITSNII